jgi:hypothetical protein
MLHSKCGQLFAIVGPKHQRLNFVQLSVHDFASWNTASEYEGSFIASTRLSNLRNRNKERRFSR